MKGFYLKEAADAIGAEQPGDDCHIEAVCTDSREIVKNSLFVALTGEKFDGHDYVSDALNKGAACAVVERKVKGCENALLVVKDTKRAMGDLAVWYRQKFDVKVVAVTGSVGKTTTKEFVSAILSTKFNVLKTKNSFNNDIGLPLTLFDLDDATDCAVLELGMNHKGEMERLSFIAKPDAAVITNIGTAHIENLGSQEGILNAKLEILSSLSSDGTVFLNADDALLWNLRGTLPFKTVYFGIKNDCADFVASDIVEKEDGAAFKITKPFEADMRIDVFGMHNVFNALAAAAVGSVFGLSVDEMQSGLGDFKTAYGRQEIFKRGDITFIDDTYNANPDSMAAALTVLSSLSAKRKIAVLGDMMELGDMGERLHFEVGQKCARLGIDALLTLGQRAKGYIKGAKEESEDIELMSFLDKEELVQHLKNEMRPGDALLFKASRSVRMEEVLKKICEG